MDLSIMYMHEEPIMVLMLSVSHDYHYLDEGRRREKGRRTHPK